MKKSWLLGPAAFFLMLACIIAVWAVLEPAVLVDAFDKDGRSVVEIATLAVFALIIPCLWILNPFGGSAGRRALLAFALTVVVLMAMVKELDLHVDFVRWLYPSCIGEDGSMAPGFYKPDGRPLTGTPFKMRVITNGAVPFGLKAVICLYFALLFGIFALLFACFSVKWLKGVFSLDPVAWVWGCACASGAMVQICDRLPSWLDHAFGLGRSADGSVTAASSFCTALEEGGEMMLALLSVLTIYAGWRKLKGNRP